MLAVEELRPFAVRSSQFAVEDLLLTVDRKHFYGSEIFLWIGKRLWIGNDSRLWIGNMSVDLAAPLVRRPPSNRLSDRC